MRLQEWVGYCLLPQVIGTLQKSLFFIGEGSNGKSVFLETIASILDNVSHLELSELFDRFKIAEIEGKLANICTDVETSKVMDARFKKIVAGEPNQLKENLRILFSSSLLQRSFSVPMTLSLPRTEPMVFIAVSTF